MIFELLILAISLLSLVLWIVIIVARQVSYWPKLAKHYRARRLFDGYTWQIRSESGRGLQRSRGGLTIGVNPEGMYLAVMAMGEHGYLPLFIPWQDVSVAGEGPLTVFTFQKVPDAKLRLDEALGREVLERARGATTMPPA